MGSMKEHMMDLQEARFLEWAAEHYPDVSPDTPEWEQIGNYYSWEQEALEVHFYEEMLLTRHEEHLRDRASLENMEQRFLHAMSELDALDDLIKIPQTELIWRMGIAHSVSVLDAFFMYCARALLNHDWPLRRFRDEFFLKSVSLKFRKNINTDDILLFRDSARRYLSSRTFQNPKFIKDYFSAVLHVRCDWPLYPLEPLNELRNDLIHRNAYTRTGEQVYVSAGDLKKAVLVVRNIVDTAMGTLRMEQSFFGNGRQEEEREFAAAILGINLTGDKRDRTR